MPFDVLTTITQTTARMCASISYRRNDTKHGKGKLPKLVIAIPKAMMGKTVTKTDKYAFMIGSGADHGKGRIARLSPKAETPGVNPTIFVGGIVFRFGHVPMLGDSAADKEDMALREIEGGWEFDLPAWFRPDEPETETETETEGEAGTSMVQPRLAEPKAEISLKSLRSEAPDRGKRGQLSRRG